MTDTTLEARVRRALSKEGFFLRKSRLRSAPHLDDFGEYRVVDRQDHIVLGARFDWDLAEIDDWLRKVRNAG